MKTISPMAEANVRIIDELKKFLNASMEQQVLKEKYIEKSSKGFTRKRILTFPVVVMLILNALKRSLNIELRDFFGQVFQRVSCTKQAFSRRRTNLRPEFFEDWNRTLVENFYVQYGKHVKRWKGMKLWSVDGSTSSLPDTVELRRHFGQSSNQSGDCPATARISVIYDVLNQVAVKGKLHPYCASEEDMAFESFKGLSLTGGLLLFDRGYPSFWFLFELCHDHPGVRFVMRCPRNFNSAVTAFMASPAVDAIVQIHPPYSSLKHLRQTGFEVTRETYVEIRVVKIPLSTGETEILITNLYDSVLYDTRDLGCVYHMRWGVETFYGHMKNELQLEQFSGIRRLCVEQDFAAGLFLYNLQSLVEKQAEPRVQEKSRGRMYCCKVNKNISWDLLKHRVVKLFPEEDSCVILEELAGLFARYLEPVRPGRKPPRKKKAKSGGKYRTLTNYKRAL